MSKYKGYKTNIPMSHDIDDKTKLPLIPFYAENILDKGGYYDVEAIQDCIEDNPVDPDEKYTGYQLSLDLVSKDDLILQLENQIAKFRRSQEIMAMYALRWHTLMEDVESNKSIAELFDSIQLLRKMSGGSVI